MEDCTFSNDILKNLLQNENLPCLSNLVQTYSFRSKWFNLGQKKSLNSKPKDNFINERFREFVNKGLREFFNKI